MKSKFKCKNVHKNASCSSHSRSRTNEMITVASTNDGRDSTLRPTVENPTKEHRWAFCAENINIAPIFLPRTATKHGTNMWIGQQEVDFPRQIQRERQVKSVQDAKYSCDTANREVRHRERLPPPDVTTCLEEIQRSNPAFPAQTTLSYLQEKSRALRSGNAASLLLICFAIHVVQCFVSICSVQHPQQTIQTSSLLQNHTEHGSLEKVPKRPRLCLTAGRTAVAVDQPASSQDGAERTAPNHLQPRSSQLSRTRRLKQSNAWRLVKKSEEQSDKTTSDPQKGK